MLDIVGLLDWTDEAAVSQACAALRNRHESFILVGLSGVLAEDAARESARASAVARVRAALNELPEDAMRRVLNAPETCYRLYQYRRGGPERLVKFLERSLAAERFRVQRSGSLPGGVWCALGDRFFAAPFGRADDAERGWLLEPERDYEAPVLENGIVVDFVSPYAARPLEANNFRPAFSPPRPLALGERRAALDKLVEGARGLRLGCPAGAAFVSALLRTVMPRADATVPGFKGGSNRAFIGRANLMNPERDGVNAANVATSLLHEAVHTCLYLSELDKAPVSDQGVMYEQLIESPWSGRQVHLLALIHASFVWYAIHRFWESRAVRACLGDGVGDYYLAYTRSGFAGGKMLARLEPVRRYIRPDLMECLAELQGRMGGLR